MGQVSVKFFIVKNNRKLGKENFDFWYKSNIFCDFPHCGQAKKRAFTALKIY